MAHSSESDIQPINETKERLSYLNFTDPDNLKCIKHARISIIKNVVNTCLKCRPDLGLTGEILSFKSVENKSKSPFISPKFIYLVTNETAKHDQIKEYLGRICPLVERGRKRKQSGFGLVKHSFIDDLSVRLSYLNRFGPIQLYSIRKKYEQTEYKCDSCDRILKSHIGYISHKNKHSTCSTTSNTI